ncbi:protein FAR1-RELATED SEQUENCE 9-like [Citrus sinensis]|uniref:protein FAR1-RELATED SEQUENCE 9-like n=1 Tax=Citrus sinensis TaxID=2711 RepID=UPI00227935C1|nr:protein FAR1-RELATED SEQUENCE 9-like [Citrus sinensis]
MEYLENEHAFEELQETRANDGKQEGFPVKVRSTKKETDGIVKYATFACGRSGKSESKSANALKPKQNVKNGCDAKIGGIRIAQNFNSIVVGAGGYENVSFLENDCRNFVDRTRRLQLEEGDAMALLKAAYKYFGDVITFDTTYLTNKYDMPFAPFVGVNHHGQSILLGCGLILREDTETFTWLFEAWLSCMSDSPPFGIITDQDRAMQKFVKQYENALRRKAELEWQADTKCFSKRTPCVSRYEMERQVEEVYTISKFKEFQEELTALMYCDISNSVGSINQIIESFGQGRRGFFEVVFEEAECEVNCICSKFQFRGILCRHALAVLIRNSVELLPEKYILSRWRKDVRRCYSKLKVCYGVQNLTIQQER